MAKQCSKGKNKQGVRSENAQAERFLTRVAITIDTLLRLKLEGEKADYQHHLPVKPSEAVQYLKQVSQQK